MTTMLGIDLSLTSTGIAVAQNGELREVFNVKSKGRKTDTLLDRYQRLEQILLEISWAYAAYDYAYPLNVVIESPAYGSRFGSPHDRSGLWWKVVSFFQERDIPVHTVAPQGRAKYATGAGNAKKDVVLAHVIERYSSDTIRIANDDVADAVVLVAMLSRHLGYPIEAVEPPEANLAAMAGGAWV